MEIVPFKAEHVLQLKLQEAQAHHFGIINLEYARALEMAGNAYSAVAADGHPIACAGIVEQWPHRGLAWSLIGEDAGPHFVNITRAVRRMLDIVHFHRIEMHVDCEFPQAMRWAGMLGFEVESKMRLFTETGRDAFMYVRLNPHLHDKR